MEATKAYVTELETESTAESSGTYFDRCDLMEIFGIWNAQAAHAMLMSPLFEVSLKGSPTPVTVIPTYLAFELLQISKHR